MAYVYRFDSWSSHLGLFGGELRARYWSRKTRDVFPHASLIEAERTLGSSQAVFRISFWKNLAAAQQNLKMSSGRELLVLQRVPTGHPFFQSFTREDDDYLSSTAWLYWKIDRRIDGQEWSLDGIPTDDVEILDVDGSWRRFREALVMGPAEARLAGQGFRPFYFGSYPGAAFFSSRSTFNGLGERSVWVLLYHPPESNARIYQDRRWLEAFVLSFLTSHAVELSAVRFVVFDDSIIKHDVRVWEFQPIPEGKQKLGMRRWLGRLLLNEPEQTEEPIYRMQGEDLRIWSVDSEFACQLESLFNLLTTKRTELAREI